jgi:hypothetical protein
LTGLGFAPEGIGKLTVAQLQILITPARDAGTRVLMSIAEAQKLRHCHEAERERWIAERMTANLRTTHAANVVHRASIESLRILKELELCDRQCDSGDVRTSESAGDGSKQAELPPTRSEYVASRNPLATSGRGSNPVADRLLSEILNILKSPSRESDVPRFLAGSDL